MHAAFALHGLKDYGAHVMIGECRLERCDVILRNVDKSARQRLESLLFSGCAVAASVASVRPWKLFVMVTMVEPRYRNASRRDARA